MQVEAVWSRRFTQWKPPQKNYNKLKRAEEGTATKIVCCILYRLYCNAVVNGSTANSNKQQATLGLLKQENAEPGERIVPAKQARSKLFY